MTTIYHVVRREDYEGSEVCAVFSTLGKAIKNLEEIIELQNKRGLRFKKEVDEGHSYRNGCDVYCIEEHVLDDPYPVESRKRRLSSSDDREKKKQKMREYANVPEVIFIFFTLSLFRKADISNDTNSAVIACMKRIVQLLTQTPWGRLNKKMVTEFGKIVAFLEDPSRIFWVKDPVAHILENDIYINFNLISGISPNVQIPAFDDTWDTRKECEFVALMADFQLDLMDGKGFFSCVETNFGKMGNEAYRYLRDKLFKKMISKVNNIPFYIDE